MASSSKNQRKYGRNAAFCKAYKLSNRRERNKIKKIKRHLKQYPADNVAIVAVENCTKTIRGY